MDAAETHSAVESEQRDRDEAFLAFPEAVAGFDLRPMTLRDWLILIGCNNCFLKGVPAEVQGPERLERFARDASRFVWLQSVTYEARNKEAHRAIEAQLGETDLADLIVGIQEYIDRAFYDQPAGRVPIAETKSASYWSIATDMVHAMGKSYGWSRSQTLEEPLRVLWQLFNAQLFENNPKRPRFNPSDNITAKLLKEIREKENAS